MSIDATALANLLSLSLGAIAGGEKPKVCAFLKVTWDANDNAQTKYYSDSAYHELNPFFGVGHTIEPRIIIGNGKSLAETVEFELNSDLTTDNIKFTFNDIDKTITGKFQSFGSGVQCELFFYYAISPTPITTSVWFGQLQAPEVYGWSRLECVATNGFRSRELLLPRRTRPRECTSNFGGLATAEASQTMICLYQKQNGGLGNINPLTGLPYAACPRLSEADCILRLGADSRGRAKYFGGFVVGSSAVAFPAHHDPGYIAVSVGNATRLPDPIRVIAGTMHVRGLQLLDWSKIAPATDPNGWVDGVWEVGEGPVQSVYNVQVRDTNITNGLGANYRIMMLGARGQSNTGYAQNTVSNFSGTALFRAVYGQPGTSNRQTTAQDLTGECDCVGYNNVAVFDAMGAYVRQWTANRVWWLLEMYSNQRWGMAYPFSRFTTADFKTAADWTDALIQFAVTYPDGETRSFAHTRSTFNAVIEGRPCSEVITDVCRVGGFSIPFQNDGDFTLATFRVATAGELSAARVFTDDGESRNIVWDSGQPSIKLSQTPNDKVINEVEVTFEDSANANAARPITVDDPDQKALAGRELGDNNLKSVPKKYSAFGVTTLSEAVKIAYRFLRFGEFDSGGTHNNLKIVILTSFEQALGIKRYDIISIVSDLLNGFESPEAEAFTYFRVLKLRKVANNRCEITAQAYNHTAYTNFETAVTTHVCPAGQHWDYTLGSCVVDDDDPLGCTVGYHWDKATLMCVPDDPILNKPPQSLAISATYNATTNNLEVTVT